MLNIMCYMFSMIFIGLFGAIGAVALYEQNSSHFAVWLLLSMMMVNVFAFSVRISKRGWWK